MLLFFLSLVRFHTSFFRGLFGSLCSLSATSFLTTDQFQIRVDLGIFVDCEVVTLADDSNGDILKKEKNENSIIFSSLSWRAINGEIIRVDLLCC